jgi:hypothetical protein
VELTRGALPIADPAGRYEIHLQAHQRAPVHVPDRCPRHLDGLALILKGRPAGSGRVPAIERRVTARTAQAPEPRPDRPLMPT